MTRTNLVFLAVGLLLIVVGYRAFISGGHHPGGGEAIVEVIVPSLDGDTAAGEALFNESCASCHGEDAAGRDGLAPPLVHIIYEPNHHGDGSFYSAVQKWSTTTSLAFWQHAAGGRCQRGRDGKNHQLCPHTSARQRHKLKTTGA